MKRNRAFTFLEVTLAISILAVVMSVAYTALSQIIRTKKLLDDIRDNKNIADAILIRVSRELQMVYSGPGSELMPPRNNLTKPYLGGPRVLGKPEQDLDGNHKDSIEFSALEGGQYIPEGKTHTGVVQIWYRVEKDPKNKESSTYTLVRDETPHLPDFAAAYKKTMVFPITDRLVSLQFRYFDDRNDVWVDSWGTMPRVYLPRIVRFTVAVQSPLGRVDSYSTSISIPPS